VYFAIYAIDKPDQRPARDRLRGAHRRFVRSQTEFPVTVHVAGPLFADDGTTMVGSLMLVEAADLETVRHFVAKIPYLAAQLFERVEIRPYGWSLHPPSGKK